MVSIIWLLFATALVYSCCDKEAKSRPILITYAWNRLSISFTSFFFSALVLSSLFSIFLWTIAMAVLLIGGHGEVFICRPLYDQPDYKSLSELIDDPGVIYLYGGGLFKNLLSRNQTLDVPIKSMLGCVDDSLMKVFEGTQSINFHYTASARKTTPPIRPSASMTSSTLSIILRCGGKFFNLFINSILI